MIRTAQIALMLSLMIAGLFSLAVPAGAGKPDREQDIARQALHRGDVVPLKTILRITLAREPGEIVKVELEFEHGRLIYEIKVLRKDGNLRKLRYDARSGAYLGTEKD